MAAADDEKELDRMWLIGTDRGEGRRALLDDDRVGAARL
jgi:hypothetical protein